MRHVLRKTPGNKNVDFDDINGAVVGVAESTISVGICRFVGTTSLAFYAANDALVLQLGSLKFPMDSSATKLDYRHDWGSGMTTFTVSGSAGIQKLTYQAWWSELGLAADDVQFEPERDEEEDYLAFIFAAWKDSDLSQRLLGGWSAVS